MSTDRDWGGTDQRLPRIGATMPIGEPPLWAVLELRLLSALDEAWRVFADRYCATDGSLIGGDGRVGHDADDFYEPFFNWPVLYLLAGSADLLAASKRHWTGVTDQLTRLGLVTDEFVRAHDWFHLGEAQLFFYGICAADPADESFRNRAFRFAELYLPGSPAGNYDGVHNVITGSYNGSAGTADGLSDAGMDPYSTALESMRTYGLPLDDVEGIGEWDDLADPDLAHRMGEAIVRRLGPGDTVVNVAATSLAANAWLYGHDPKYRDWTLRYLGGWLERMVQNDGILPDNVGPSGQVGEAHRGAWFGGYYGWRWPHGLRSVGASALIGAVNATMLGGHDRYLELGRGPLELVLGHARMARVSEEPSSLSEESIVHLGESADTASMLVPYRYTSTGWFDFQPYPVRFALWLWWLAGRPEDYRRLQKLRAGAGVDWRPVRAFRDKEEGGHEEAWFAYLEGDNPGYPERILAEAYSQVMRRLDLIASDEADPAHAHVHHWQQLNPVLTEALLHVVTGSPQVIYNGGLPMFRLRYFDALRRSVGLPADVAALVSHIGPDRVEIELVNISPVHDRRVLLIAGGHGEHQFRGVTYSALASPYPGDPFAAAVAPAQSGAATLEMNSTAIEVDLPARRSIQMQLSIDMNVNQPRHLDPFEDHWTWSVK